jgi:hypothetical protein
VKVNAGELNFDILGYYHVSQFATRYSFAGSNAITIDLNKNGDVYNPILNVSLLGINRTFSPAIYWNSIPSAPEDDKLYDNGKIAFYRKGN